MASTIVTPPAAQNLTRNPIYVTLESDHMTGAGPYAPDVDNLSCHLEVWRDVGAGEERLGSPLRAPYSSVDKRVTFDLAGLFPRVITLPTEISIGISPGSDPYYGEAVGLTDIFRLKHADQFGDPVVVDALTTSADYLAINGGLPADHVQNVNLSAALIGLHSYYYKRDSAFIFRVPVSTNQPNWLYYISLVTDNIIVQVTRNYSDGTNDNYTAVTIASEANKAYWVQSGFDQLKVIIDSDPDKTIIGYDVSFIRETGMQNAFTAFYVLDNECPSWERFILYHNGFGGYESVRMKGLTRYTQRVSRETFQRTRWIDFDIKTGDIDQIRTLGGAVFNTHTGHYPAHYCDHLRQLLHGKLWLIDLDLIELESYRFKRIICESDNIEPRLDEAGPHGFAITYAHAWLDDGYNTY